LTALRSARQRARAFSAPDAVLQVHSGVRDGAGGLVVAAPLSLQSGGSPKTLPIAPIRPGLRPNASHAAWRGAPSKFSLIRCAVGILGSEFAEQEHDVSYAGPDRRVVECDPARMRRCLSNLIENGVVHGGGALARLTDFGPDRVVIAIEDRGPGIASAERTALFEPFRRGDAARSSAGFGLGLSIAQEIAIQHGGTIELADNEPHGLIVRIVLPVAAERSKVAASAVVAG
jgi:C4-dicarboxylate-specific signal transduction histidine kinase